MKQHITPQQWNELSKEQQFTYGQWSSSNLKDKWNKIYIESFGYPSIGQMIEYLGDNWIELYNNTFSRMTVEDYMEVDEMCDHLLEAVKYKLTCINTAKYNNYN